MNQELFTGEISAKFFHGFLVSIKKMQDKWNYCCTSIEISGSRYVGSTETQEEALDMVNRIISKSKKCPLLYL